VKSCAVIHTGGLGDFLQTFPVLAALRAKWPRGRITIIGRSDRAGLAVAGGLADDAVDFETSGLHPLFGDDAPASPAPPRLADFDLVLNYLPHESFNANLSRLTAARLIHATGFPAPGECDRPVAQFVYDQIAPQLQLPPCEAIPRLHLRPDHPSRQAMAARFPEAPRAMAIHAGSGSPRKNWPLERFEELAGALADAGMPTIWLFGPAELECGDFAALARAGRSLSAAPLVEVAALLSLVRGYIGNDSGITHLAAAVGTSTIALFGPTDTAVWSPRGPNVRILEAPEGKLSRLSVSAVRETARSIGHS